MGVANFKSLTVAFVAAAFWLGNVERLGAVPSPEQHEMSGTVQRVDRETITIVPAGESKPVVFTWNKDTKFVRNGAFTTADALHPGTQATIRCSHPIFGSKPLLYRVTWQGTSSTRKTGDKQKSSPSR
jgi:hypothetical protein